MFCCLINGVPFTTQMSWVGGLIGGFTLSNFSHDWEPFSQFLTCTHLAMTVLTDPSLLAEPSVPVTVYSTLLDITVKLPSEPTLA